MPNNHSLKVSYKIKVVLVNRYTYPISDIHLRALPRGTFGIRCEQYRQLYTL